MRKTRKIKTSVPAYTRRTPISKIKTSVSGYTRRTSTSNVNTSVPADTRRTPISKIKTSVSGYTRRTSISNVNTSVPADTRRASISNVNLNADSFLSFSSILQKKYSGHRVAPSAAPSAWTEWNNNLTTSGIEFKDRKLQTRDQATSISIYPETPEPTQEELIIPRRRKQRLRPYYYTLLGIALLLGIGIMIFALLFKCSCKNSITTTTATTTTTSVTTATTTTSTTSTTKTTSTSSTSTTTTTSTTSSETTSTSTSTTSETTTTTTTDTTTTTACYFGGDYVNLVEGGQRRISHLKAGDRVWTLSDDGQRMIEDEIMCIPHAGPTALTEFYTFITIEGQTISLTGSHYIVVATDDENHMKIKRASSVTLDDRLIMANRSINLQRILQSELIGYYSPITLSGYLLVNNISTSVYVNFLLGTHHFFHQLTGPARIYYHITRWLFGNDYIPFATSTNEEIHPLSIFVMENYERIQAICTGLPYLIPTISTILIMFSIRKTYYF